MASSSPRKKGAGSKASASSAVAVSTPPVAPPRAVPFVTVACSSYSQLFSTLCRPALFLSAAAAELSSHLQQRAEDRLLEVRRTRAEGDALQAKAQETTQSGVSGQEEEEKQQLQPAASAASPSAELWPEERRRLDEEEQRLQADLLTLSRLTGVDCAFDLRSSLGQPLRLHEMGTTGTVREVVSGAAEYTLLIAQKRAEDGTLNPKLAFQPLALQAV